MNKDSFYRIFLSVLLIIIILMAFRIGNIQNTADHETSDLKKSIIASDKLVKEADGRYSKLVNYYASERTLINDLKESNIELYKTIKQQGEKILNITSAVISLDKKVVQGFGKQDPLDTNKLNLSLKYPSEIDPFIFWDGSINKHTAEYNGIFSFGKLPVKIILTEEKRGLWKSRLVGPEWLKVDSMSILSLPPELYPTVKPKNIQWLVGGTYYYGLNSTSKAIGVNFGLNLFDKHNIIIGANTLQQVSFGYTHKIKTFKRNK
jgi:hypothetical protein